MKNSKAITLISLVLTIVVILILSAITVNMVTGENGIIKNTDNAKEQTEIANEKEIIKRAVVGAMGKDKYGDLQKNGFQEQLNKENEQIDVVESGENLGVIFRNSKRYYIVGLDGNISEVQKMIDDKNAGDITKGGTLNGVDKPYEINCIEDLVAFSNMVNGNGIIVENEKAQEVTEKYNFEGKKIVLKRNLDFKSELSYQNSQRTDFGDINGVDDENTLINELTTGKGFKPIGQYRTEFKGDFDGMNNKILNLYENDSVDDMGLFGCIYNANIRNLYVQGKIEANTGGRVGGLSGATFDTDINIDNCIVNIDINSKLANTGGFFAATWGEGTINFTNCGNLGNINVSNSLSANGGFIGTIESNVNIYNSYNLGNIKLILDKGNGGTEAGMIGTIFSHNLNVINSFNAGDIGGKDGSKRGGIVGDSARTTGDLTLRNVYNFGKINGILGAWMFGIGSLVGYGADTTKATITINGCSYLQGTADVAVYKKDDSEYGVTKLESFKYAELVQKLNDFIENEQKSEWNLWKIGDDFKPCFIN